MTEAAAPSSDAVTAAPLAVAIHSYHCRNCDFSFSASQAKPKFCPACGQDTHEHPPTVGEFLHEFLLHYVALEGKLWRTLGKLFFQPGALTVAYLNGVKTRYIPPLRIYLTASILFFLIVKFAGAGNLFRSDAETVTPTSAAPAVAPAPVPSATSAATIDAKPGRPAVGAGRDPRTTGGTGVKLEGFDAVALQKPAASILVCEGDANNGACRKIRDYFVKRYAGQSIGQMGAHVKERMLSLAPYAMFFFLPVFALLMKVFYRGRGMYYGEHLVYAFHVHAFSFFVLLGVAFIPDSVTWVLALWGTVYYWLAMRSVYGGRRWTTTLRYAAIGVVYPILLALLIGAVLLAAVFL